MGSLACLVRTGLLVTQGRKGLLERKVLSVRLVRKAPSGTRAHVE